MIYILQKNYRCNQQCQIILFFILSPLPCLPMSIMTMIHLRVQQRDNIDDTAVVMMAASFITHYLVKIFIIKLSV